LRCRLKTWIQDKVTNDFVNILHYIILTIECEGLILEFQTKLKHVHRKDYLISSFICLAGDLHAIKNESLTAFKPDTFVINNSRINCDSKSNNENKVDLKRMKLVELRETTLTLRATVYVNRHLQLLKFIVLP
jgi:hypothetical protein